jgi:trimethylamine--corrinoid protein Co-methyltransferase
LGASDAKLVDAQAGLESGVTAVIGALAGVNMISGAGMLDFLACQSVEKLVIDAEAIAMAQRLVAGIQVHTDTLATALFEGIQFKGEFLKHKLTRQLFAKEQYLPSPVIDRDTIRGWQGSGGLDAFARARERVGALLVGYQPPDLPAGQRAALVSFVRRLAKASGMDHLPSTE